MSKQRVVTSDRLIILQVLWICCSRLDSLSVTSTPPPLHIELQTEASVDNAEAFPGGQLVEDTQSDGGGMSLSSNFLDDYIKCHGFPCAVYEEISAKMSELRQLMEGTNPRVGSFESLVLDGDILLTTDQLDTMIAKAKKPSRRKRQLQTSAANKWAFPIPFRIHPLLNGTGADTIRKAVLYWQSQTCIQFREVLTDNDVPPIGQPYVMFIAFGTACASYVGQTTAFIPQPVYIAPACISSVGGVAHEIGHVVGFWHEHQRSDRDTYVTINANNIAPQYDSLQLVPKGDTRNVEPFDFGSLMEYNPWAFSYNLSLMTIQPKDLMVIGLMGQKFGLSFLDTAAANLEYCSAVCQFASLGQQCQNRGYQDPKNCSQCRCQDGFAGRFCQFLSPSSPSVQCGGIVQLPLGQVVTISTPGYDQNQPYADNTSCTWFFNTTVGNNMVFDIHSFDFGMYCENRLCFHWLEIRSTLDLTLSGTRYCCYKQIDPIFTIRSVVTSQGSSMMLLFRSDNSAQTYPSWGKRGFKALIYAQPILQANIVFVVESSESLGYNNWNTVKSFVQSITASFQVGLKNFLFSFVSYGSVVSIEFFLDNYTNQSSLSAGIIAVPYMNGASYISGGMYAAVNVFNSLGGRSGIPNICVLFTDGVSDVGNSDVVPATLALRSVSSVLVVGLTPRPKAPTLLSLSGDVNMIVNVTSVNSLATFLPTVVQLITSKSVTSPPLYEDAQSPNYSWSCDFENAQNPFCGMILSPLGIFNWTRYTGKTPSAMTGPSSAESGIWYIYIEASDRNLGDYAIIFSPPVPYASQYCLTFYYSMYGFHIYWLKVYVTSMATMSSTLVWSMFGQQGNFWLKAQLTVQMQQAAQIQWTGIRGSEYSGDIGVDNISLIQGSC